MFACKKHHECFVMPAVDVCVCLTVRMQDALRVCVCLTIRMQDALRACVCLTIRMQGTPERRAHLMEDRVCLSLIEDHPNILGRLKDSLPQVGQVSVDAFRCCFSSVVSALKPTCACGRL